jgi:hypothetical protein
MAGDLEIAANTLRRLRVDGDGLSISLSLSSDPQCVQASVPMQGVDEQPRDFRSAEADLKPHGEDGPVSQTNDGFPVGRVEYFARFFLGKGERSAFAAIDLRPLDLPHGICRYDVVLDEMSVQTRECRQAAADRRRFELFDFPHPVFPENHCSMVCSVQGLSRLNADRVQKVGHIKLVGSPSVLRLESGDPDLFLGDACERIEGQ